MSQTLTHTGFGPWPLDRAQPEPIASPRSARRRSLGSLPFGPPADAAPTDAAPAESGVAEPAGSAPALTEDADDATLVAAAKQNRDAFALLYARYLTPVLRFCEARLSSPEEAEDAASQIFAKAMVALPTCRDDRFRYWLFTIARNVITDIYRRRANRPSGPLEFAELIPDAAPTPEEHALIEAERQQMHDLLHHLTPDQRRVVELRLAGLNGPEIAKALGITHNSVKVHQFRAIQRLRGVLERERAEREGGAE